MTSQRRLLFLIFAFSGFSGLIYESIWTHYLKLFLGHAAYAQTLVLAIFMGGMALGSWWCGARSARWKNLLRGYALVEGIIGVTALVFHPLFDGYVQFSYTTLLPAIGDPAWVTAFKWSSAALLILPQSILLGMTFPLLSGALIRRYPDNPGATVSMLYFTNSIGAAIGVLVSGFVLIELVGLPGTIILAGVLNIALALIVWRLARSQAAEPQFSQPAMAQTRYSERRWLAFFLAIAAFTGAASFIYEIVWIRMLALVLGSSTHAFELMLSAFILGLALGGLWIKRRIDRIAHPVRFLAIVQILMGALAASTLFIYNQSFDVMAWLVNNLSKDDAGYALFNLASHAIAAVIMVPTTFLAGMTLPLLTYTLLQQGHGEKSIGSVYASNTFGAIIGVFFATHLGMPLLGLKGLLLTGAALDVALGVLLIWWFREQLAPHWATAATALGAGMLAFTLAAGPMDLSRLSSGVYRTGKLNPSDYINLYHKDGKTASIDLVQSTNTSGMRSVSIMTNGKPDAMVNMISSGAPTPDESTMILAGALPLALHPTATSAAVIGMGSGLSTHTLLSTPQLSTVDTIEIEPAVIEASNGFRPRVELAYSSSQGHFHIDDAKSFFSTYNRHYDIIMSEPSNPWVSGTAALFTEEFYILAKRHLAPQGVLVQWLQTYEINDELVASVLKALSRQFDHYVIYAANFSDLIIVARAEEALPMPTADIFEQDGINAALARIGISNARDLELHRIGDEHALAPLFASYAISANSDYFPVLDLGATRARFLRSSANNLIVFRNAGVPALEMLSAPAPNRSASSASENPSYHRSQYTRTAVQLLDYFIRDGNEALPGVDIAMANNARFVQAAFIECRIDPATAAWLHDASAVINLMIPQLTRDEMSQVWQRIGAARCFGSISPQQRSWIALWSAVTRRDPGGMLRQSTALLPDALATVGPTHTEYLLLCALLGAVMQNDRNTAQHLWARYAPGLYQTLKPALVARLLAAHAYAGAPIPYLH